MACWTLGGLTSPFPFLIMEKGGGPRQAPKGGTLSHLAYWNLLHTVPERFSGFFVVFRCFPAKTSNPLHPSQTPLHPPRPPCTPPPPRQPGRPDPLPPPNPGPWITEFGPRFKRLRAFMITQYWMLRNRLDIQLRNVCLIFRYGWLQSLWTPWTPFAPPPGNSGIYSWVKGQDRESAWHSMQRAGCGRSRTEVRRWVKSLQNGGYA